MKINSYVYALITIFLWGTVAAVAKLTLGTINSVQLLLYVGLFTVLSLFFVTVFTKRADILISLKKEDLFHFAFLGSVGLFLNMALFFMALDIAPAVEVSVLNYLWPIAIIFFSITLLKEKLNAKTVAALLLGFVGAFFVISKGDLAFGFTNIYGDILAIFAAICWGLFSVLSKKKRFDSIASMFLYSLFAMIFILIYAVLTNNLTFIPVTDMLGAAYIGILATALAHTSWIKALKIGNIQKITILSYLTPFLSVLFIAILVKESIEIFQLFGLLLIVLGVLLHHFK